jgi:predicted amidohydrolase
LGRPQANRTYFEAEINTISGAVDLIVLPEMFSTGFTMNPSAIAETMQGETVLWMQSLAKKRGYNRKRSNQKVLIIIIGCYLFSFRRNTTLR